MTQVDQFTVTRSRAGATLAIVPGTRMLATFNGMSDNHACDLIGYQACDYLVVRMPLVPGIRSYLTPGQGIKVRYLQGGTIFGFSAQVLSHVPRPAFLAFISYPDEIEVVELRQHRRVSCLLPASLHGAQGIYKAIMLDLSAGGCKVSVEAERNHPLRSLKPHDMCVLHTTLAEGGGAIVLSCLIKGIAIEGDRVQLGLQFMDLDDMTQLAITGFLDSVSCVL